MDRAVLATRFLLELVLLGPLAEGGWALAGGGVAGGALAVVAAVAGAAGWGAWIAPRAKRRLSDPGRLGLEIALFLPGGVALWAAWRPAAGVVFTVASAVVAVLTRRVGEPTPGVG